MSVNKEPVKDEIGNEHCAGSDTFIDKYFNRKISVVITSVLLKTPLTANHVTILNTFVGLLAAFLFTKGSYYNLLVAALVYQLNTIIDHCDGEIARAKNQSSRFGFLLDLLTDGIIAGAVMVCIGLGLSLSLNNYLYFMLGVVAGTGAFVSSMLIFYNAKQIKGGVNTVSFTGKNSGNLPTALESFVDNITNRNMSFYILISVLIGKLDILLIIMAIGAQIHWIAVLIVVYKRRWSKS
ncbi:MAG: CDP-alcohol phosphatidyltransferase family protein [Candidatus Anammoxibacter sp.]